MIKMERKYKNNLNAKLDSLDVRTKWYNGKESTVNRALGGSTYPG
jgi:hypothetical protein